MENTNLKDIQQKLDEARDQYLHDSYGEIWLDVDALAGIVLELIQKSETAAVQAERERITRAFEDAARDAYAYALRNLGPSTMYLRDISDTWDKAVELIRRSSA